MGVVIANLLLSSLFFSTFWVWSVDGEPSLTKVARNKPHTVGDAANKDGIIMENKMGFLCRPWSVEQFFGPGTVNIIGFEPVLSRTDGISLVHHIDLYACNDELPGFLKDPKASMTGDWCATDEFAKSCTQLSMAYDKGAGRFDFPANIAWKLGDGTAFKYIMLQTHYLLPKVWNSPDGHVDTSGLRLFLSPTNQPNRAGTFGWQDENFELPPGHANFHLVSPITADQLTAALKDQWANSKELHLFAMHLHAHNHAHEVWCDHYRGGKKIGEYGHLKNFGYGPKQTFQLVTNPEPLLKGDELIFHCVYDTTGKTQPIYYGVEHGDEMCGPLVMFYPSVDSKDVTLVDTLGNAVSERNFKRLQASGGKIGGFAKGFHQWSQGDKMADGADVGGNSLEPA